MHAPRKQVPPPEFVLALVSEGPRPRAASRVTLTLDRTDGPTVRVVNARVDVTVRVAGSPRPDRVERIVHKAHRLCTIAGSLAAPVTIHVDVRSDV